VTELLAIALIVVLLIGLVLAAVILVQVLRRRRVEEGLRERAYSADPMAAGPSLSDPERISAGDVITFDAREWVVRGTLAMDEDGYQWREHLLDASGIEGEARRWLSVERAESGLELVMWDRVRGAALTPDAAELTYEGTRYRRDEQGSARFSAIGSTGTATDGTMHYADYVSDTDALLSFERFSSTGSWEMSVGHPVAAESLTILHTR
jgi:hypothetical protein